MKVLIVYYSTYGHVHKMAEAVAEGVREVPGATAELRRVPETLSDEILSAMGADEARKALDEIPVITPDELASADAVIFGTPTRFGNMCGQMRQFLDATGQLWANGALIGPRDMFSDVSYDMVRQQANEIANYIRRHGPFEPQRLPLSDMEYTTLPNVLKKLKDRFK